MRRHSGPVLPVFVYGILRSGYRGREIIGPAARSFRPAVAPDQALYSPGLAYVVDAPGRQVVGELVELDPVTYDAALAKLDHLEGFLEHAPGRSHYRRVARAVLCEGVPQLAWVYHAGPSTHARLQRRHLVPSGDWLDTQRATRRPAQDQEVARWP